MKEVKAFIRCIKAEEVIEALDALNISDITLIDVMGVGQHMVDKKNVKYSVKCVQRYSEVAKLEVVCADEHVHQVVETIREKAFTNMKGDGMIYVSPVEMAVKIRTGAVGEQAL